MISGFFSGLTGGLFGLLAGPIASGFVSTSQPRLRDRILISIVTPLAVVGMAVSLFMMVVGAFSPGAGP
jgi:hypothetical protein